MILNEEVPTSLRDAYRFINDDRAWVACLVRGDGEIATLASSVKTSQLMFDPVASQYLTPDCPKLDRASFLLGGIHALEQDFFG